MATVLISLRSEFYKFKKSTILFSSLLFPLLIVGLFIWGLAGHAPTEEPIKENISMLGLYQWGQYIANLGSTLSTFLIPMFTMFVAYSVNDIEHKSDMWKSLFSLPISKFGIYAGKYLFAICLLLLTMLTFYILSWLGIHFLSGFNKGFHYGDYTKGYNDMLLYFCKFFLSSLGILSVQMTFSFVWKDFFKPMGIGLLGIIVGNIWAFRKPETAQWFPYSQPFKAAFIARPDLKTKHIDLFQNFDIFSSEIVLSLVYLVAFAILGFFIVSKKNTK